MSKAGKRLGRGLDSLITDLRAQDERSEGAVMLPRRTGASTPAAAGPDEASAAWLETAMLRPNPFQPRSNTTDENIASLAESIRQSGMLQPVLVRIKEGEYQIIAGERRWAAASSLGMRKIPVILRQASDQEMLELALIENIHREDLNPIDRAQAYRNYCNEFDMKPERIAERLGEDRTTVLNYLRLLDLSDSVRKLVADGMMSMGHARCLLGVSDEARRLELAEAVVANSLSVRALEDIVRRERGRATGEKPGPARPPKLRTAHVQDLERRLEEAVKTKVMVREGRRKGTGRIIIEYYSLDDFDRISGMLGLASE